MLPELSIGCCLLAITVMIHAAGLTAVLRYILNSSLLLDVRLGRLATVLVCVAWTLLMLHLVEIGLWALVYWWQRCFPDLESSLYFSGVTYTTLGYGDLLLLHDWRLLAPLEALTGILMSGLSISFFFVLMTKGVAARTAARSATGERTG